MYVNLNWNVRSGLGWEGGGADEEEEDDGGGRASGVIDDVDAGTARARAIESVFESAFSTGRRKTCTLVSCTKTSLESSRL